MQCKRCGTDNPVSRLYCDECGAELEHNIQDIQATVQQQIRVERAAATAKSIRWFLTLAFIVFLAGIFFRNAYRDLPPSDVVAFVNPPIARVEEIDTATTTHFGIPLPKAKPVPPPRRPRLDPAITAQVADDAYKLAAVTVRHKKSNDPASGLLIGDAVLYATPTGQDAPVPIHVADVRSLRPLDKGAWEIAPRGGMGKPLQATIADADKIELLFLPKGAEEPIAIPLANVQEIKPM